MPQAGIERIFSSANNRPPKSSKGWWDTLKNTHCDSTERARKVGQGKLLIRQCCLRPPLDTIIVEKADPRVYFKSKSPLEVLWRRTRHDPASCERRPWPALWPTSRQQQRRKCPQLLRARSLKRPPPIFFLLPLTRSRRRAGVHARILRRTPDQQENHE